MLSSIVTAFAPIQASHYVFAGVLTLLLTGMHYMAKVKDRPFAYMRQLARLALVGSGMLIVVALLFG